MTGERIKQIRTHLGRSKARFAALLGTSAITVWRWETGKHTPQPVYVEKLIKLEAYAFGGPEK